MENDQLYLLTTTRCTNQCRHCGFACSPDKGEDMPLSIFEKSLSIALHNQYEILVFFGGEPLLNPDFFRMLSLALETPIECRIATNCRLLADPGIYDQLLKTIAGRKDKVLIVTAADQYHLQFFDPTAVIKKLEQDQLQVGVNDYCDYQIIKTEQNKHNLDFSQVNSTINCCGNEVNKFGIFPNGAWALCVSCFMPFGNINQVSFAQLKDFKESINLRADTNCTQCIQDFPFFKAQFDRRFMNREKWNRDRLF